MNVVRPIVGGPQNNLIGIYLHAYELPPDHLTTMTDWMLTQTRQVGLGTEDREPAVSRLRKSWAR